MNDAPGPACPTCGSHDTTVEGAVDAVTAVFQCSRCDATWADRTGVPARPERQAGS